MKKETLTTFSLLLLSIFTYAQLPYWGNRSAPVPLIPTEDCRTYEITSTTPWAVNYSYTGCDNKMVASAIAGTGVTRTICAKVGTILTWPENPPNGNVTITNVKCCECSGPDKDIHIYCYYMTDGTTELSFASVEFYDAPSGGNLVGTVIVTPGIPTWATPQKYSFPTATHYRVSVTVNRLPTTPAGYPKLFGQVAKQVGYGISILESAFSADGASTFSHTFTRRPLSELDILGLWYVLNIRGYAYWMP